MQRINLDTWGWRVWKIFILMVVVCSSCRPWIRATLLPLTSTPSYELWPNASPSSTAIPTPTTRPTVAPTFMPTPTVTPMPQPTSIPTTKPLRVLPAALQPGQYIVYRITNDPDNVFQIISMEGEPQGAMLIANGALSPDGKQMAQVDGNKIVLSDLVGNKLRVLTATGAGCGEADIRMPTWSPDGTQLAVSCGDTIAILDAVTGEPQGITTAPIEQTGIWWLTWSPNGKWLAYYLDNAQAQDPALGVFVTSVDCFETHDCKAKSQWIYKHSAHLVWTPDNYLVIAPKAVDYQSIRIYDVSTGKVVRTLGIPETSVALDSIAWSPDNKWVAVGQPDGIFLMSTSDAGSKPRLLTNMSSAVEFWLIVP